MIPPAFDYHAPKSLIEAIGLLSQYGSDAKVLAGGHSLLPMMKVRFANPAHLIDLNRIDALRGIREEGGQIVIGAMTLEKDILDSALLRQKAPLLPEAVRQIADPQVRYRGTIGGDIAHGDPANDHPALSLALESIFTLEGPKGRRQVAARDFFQGVYMTALTEDEILSEIRFAPLAPKTGYAYEKLKRKTGDWATAAAAVILRLSGDRVESVRIALTNAASTALRVPEAEHALTGKPLDEAAMTAAGQLAMKVCDPAEDLRGDREYKTAMTGQMVRRALARAAERCR